MDAILATLDVAPEVKEAIKQAADAEKRAAVQAAVQAAEAAKRKLEEKLEAYETQKRYETFMAERVYIHNFCHGQCRSNMAVFISGLT